MKQEGKLIEELNEIQNKIKENSCHGGIYKHILKLCKKLYKND
jgi:hypothetical protein